MWTMASFPATLLTQVTDDMLTVCDETFGPVVAVQRVANEEEAIRKPTPHIWR